MFIDCKVKDCFTSGRAHNLLVGPLTLPFRGVGEERAGPRLPMSGPSESCWGAKGLAADGSPALI